MRYISDNVISFSILVEGCSNSARVSFTPRTSGGSTFYTDSEALIKALESSEMFNNVYRRAPECVKEQVGVKKRVAKAQEKPKVVAVESVSGWQDAIEYLVENFNSNASVLNSPDKILQEAAKNNVLFSKLNK